MKPDALVNRTIEEHEVPSVKNNNKELNLHPGTKRNARVNSHGFGDMTAIAVANGLLPAQNSISFEDEIGK